MKYNVVIGYDRNNRMPAYTLAESIMQNSSVVINFIFLHRDMLKMFTREKTEKESTDFSISRFLTPFVSNYEGWSLFLDNDMIVTGDIKEVFDLCDDRYTVICTKHDQMCSSDKKFLGTNQYSYKYKNWSSVMLFNNEKCKILTPDLVNTESGMYLHQFQWINNHEEIGSIPLEWNFLVGNNQHCDDPKLIHYTLGGPYFKETIDCDYSKNWFDIYYLINDVRSMKGN